MVAGVLLLPLAVGTAAQEGQDQADAENQPLEVVIVTGSRIKRRDFTSPSPLTTIDREEFEFSGQPTLEEYLNRMPQVQPDFGRTSNNPGDGTARLNLRALGAGRTLVLLNGRRLAPSGVGSAIDVNNLPRVLVDRVEIITGGASTVYGSDAIAGVVNFITRDDFQGLSFDGSYSVSAEGDAQVYDANVVYGNELAGGGNITVYAGYYEREPLLAGERELTRFDWQDTWSGELIQAGSFRTPASVIFNPPVELGSGTGMDFATWDPDGTPRAIRAPEDLYNFAPVNYLQTPLRRYTAGLLSTLHISDRFEAYVEAAYTHNEARQQFATIPFGEVVAVNVDNPVLTPETRQLFEEQIAGGSDTAVMLLAGRPLELGPRIGDHERDYARVVAGIRGDITDGWDLDAWLTWTDASETELLINDGSRSRLRQGLLVDPATGQCFDPSGGCVPLDLFGEGRLSPEGADFLRVPPLRNTTSRTQTLASVVVTGEPFALWAGPVGMAFGAEWRSDDGDFSADEALFTGDTLGFRGAASVDGSERVYELYAEALVPLLDPARSEQSLDLELGGRWSDYEHAGSVSTWKGGLQWQPSDAVRFRAMFQHSVRAPNLAEQFTEQFVEQAFFATPNRPDPCSASQDPVGSGNADKCVIQGLDPERIGVFEATLAYPVDYVLGGNPDLQPEAADTVTAGVVITPRGLPGLTLAIDYFDMEIEDTIGEIDAALICFDSVNTGNVFCDNISRDGTGNVSEIFQPVSNRGILSTEGFDVQVQYVRDLSPAMAIFEDGALIAVSAYWTHLRSHETQENIATQVLECAGRFGWPCVPEGTVSQHGLSFPHNRLIAIFDYSSGPMDLQLSGRWIDGMNNAAPLGSAAFGFPDPDLAVPGVSSHSYFDLGLGYRISDGPLVRLVINNLLDKDPPNLSSTAVGSNNTDTGLYDVFGRSYYLSFEWRVFD